MSVGDMRREVIERDGGCMAPVLDPGAGPCFDKWGTIIRDRATVSTDLEVDYIRRDSLAPRHVLAEDHVTLCAGHHWGTGPNRGWQWATANRGLLVEYLAPYRTVAEPPDEAP